MIVRRFFGFALFGVIACAGAVQAGQQATFHLPVTATWGRAVLQPGDYRVSVPDLSYGLPEFLLNGESTKVFILPMCASVDAFRNPRVERSYLKLVNVDGMYYVENYESGSRGTEFSFKVPKPGHHVQMSKQEVVNVGVAGD